MIYTIEKLAAGKWQIMRFAPGRSIGTRVGLYVTRSEAWEAAKKMAGKTDVVQMFLSLRTAHPKQSNHVQATP